MKTIISILAAALLITGCKTNNTSTVGPALLQIGVTIAARQALADHPAARADLEIGTAIICGVAQGTNISPAAVIAELNARAPWTQGSKEILGSAIGLFTIAFNGLSDTNWPVARLYLQATCNGLTAAEMTPTATRGAARLIAPDPRWPQLK